jgi:hypothetical protein
VKHFIIDEMKQIVFLLLIFLSIKSYSQDTLPKFSAVVVGADKARISWTNPFDSCTQICVQKSYDSLRFFQTIFSSLSPELPQNGFIDKNYFTKVKMFYRIFYVLADGQYFFTKSKQAIKNTSINSTVAIDTSTKQQPFLNENIKRIFDFNTFNPTKDTVAKPFIEKRLFSIYKKTNDSLFKVLEERLYKKFKDSIATKTKDTLYTLENNIIIWKPFVPKVVWKPSLNIYTTNKGYVTINLPQSKMHKYRIVFFDDEGNEIWRIKQLKQEKLMLEKSNFMHEGWFYFEIFEDDKLKEKSKFFIEKDF